MKKIFVSFLVFSILFAGKLVAQTGGEKKGWPSSERLAFITECIKTAKEGLSEDSARFYCWCMQDKVEKSYPTIEEASKITEADMESPAWKKDIKDCLGGSWTANNRSEFLIDCIATAKDGVGEEKAKKYCECMLFKLEKMYPDHADANKLTSETLNSPAWKKIIQGCLDF